MTTTTAKTPGEHLQAEKMPGHWLLARLGKRVLRPGGRVLTGRMLEALDIGPADAVVEFAPGMGDTARRTLQRRPCSYTAVERDLDAAAIVRRYLRGPAQRCIVGRAEETGLPDTCATVVYGEAMLSMQRPEQKVRIIREACRLLKPTGRYGIHELCLRPDNLDESAKQAIGADLSQAIHHGTRPLTLAEWHVLLESEGFQIQTQYEAPMHLLEPRRLVEDEGIAGAIRFVANLVHDGQARKRVLAMRRVFKKHQANLAAVMLVARKR